MDGNADPVSEEEGAADAAPFRPKIVDLKIVDLKQTLTAA
jgi:hypothetical protein